MVEWVLWNGGDDLPPDLAKEATVYTTGQDSGIYDAMNKAVALAAGEYVLFLNGGDVLLPNLETLLGDLKGEERDVVLCNYELAAGRKIISRRARPPEYLRYGLPTSHQAIIYRREILGPEPYRAALSIVGDYELTARLWRSGATFARSNVFVSRFHSGGSSSQRPIRLAREASAVQREVLHLGVGVRSVGMARRVLSASVVAAVRFL